MFLWLLVGIIVILLVSEALVELPLWKQVIIMLLIIVTAPAILITELVEIIFSMLIE